MIQRRSDENRFASPSSILDMDGIGLDTLVCDISGSMSEKSFEKRRNKRQVMGDAIRTYLDIKRAKRPQDYLAIVAYQTTARVCCAYLNIGAQYDQLLAATKDMEKLRSGGTRMESGLLRAGEITATAPHYCGAQLPFVRILAYSDGYDSAERRAMRLAQELRDKNVLIETFGIGVSPLDVDEEFLRAIATVEDGYAHYRFLGSPDSVHETFESLAKGTLTIEG